MYGMDSMGADIPQTNIIVNYIDGAVTQDELSRLFGSMGELKSCKLVMDKATGGI